MTTSALIWIHQAIQPRTTIYVCAAKVSIHFFNSSTDITLSFLLTDIQATLNRIQHRDRVNTECTTPVSVLNIKTKSLNSPTDLHLRTRKPRIESCNAFLADRVQPSILITNHGRIIQGQEEVGWLGYVANAF